MITSYRDAERFLHGNHTVYPPGPGAWKQSSTLPKMASRPQGPGSFMWWTFDPPDPQIVLGALPSGKPALGPLPALHTAQELPSAQH